MIYLALVQIYNFASTQSASPEKDFSLQLSLLGLILGEKELI